MSEESDKQGRRSDVPPPPPSGGSLSKEEGAPSPLRNILPLVVIVGLVLIMVQVYASRKEAAKEISQSQFTEYVVSGKIKTVSIVQERSTGKSYVKGKMEKTAETPVDAKLNFKANVSEKTEKLETFLDTNNVQYDYFYQNDYMVQILTGLLPVLLVFGLLYFLFMRQMRNANGGAMGFGKSRAKLLNRDKKKLTFDNVAGIDEAQEEVQEIIEFLKDPKRFTTLGGRIPKGVLVMGPPGTGKTLLARAIAGEADVPFFSISGADFVEMFVGVGASRVRDMFEQGKKNAPCIIFIDEIDAVGRSRFTGIGGGHDEREQTLNALLVEMDGFETQEGVIMLAATNRPDVLDPALLRPGRFDRQIVIDLPLIEGRLAILNIHAKKIKLAEGLDMKRIARGTPGFSGADLENLLNEAALLAARDNLEAVTLEYLEEARDKVRWGRERRSRKMDDKEKRLTAYHEAGHALVQQIVDETEPLHKVTIIPRGSYLGATMSLPAKDRYTETKKKLLGELRALMGGRVAEEIVFDEITTGASSDISMATSISRHMVCDWGMSDELGPQAFGDNQEMMFLGRDVKRSQAMSNETAQKIDQEVHRLLTDAHDQAEDILRTNRDKLDMLAERLLELETIDGRDVEEIVEHNRVLSQEEREAIDAKNAPEPQAGEEPEVPAEEPPETESDELEVPKEDS